MAYKSYKKASEFPKGGAVAMDYDNLQACGSEILAERFCLQARAVYEWVQKREINLSRDGHLLDKAGQDFVADVINDTELCLAPENWKDEKQENGNTVTTYIGDTREFAEPA